MDSPLAPKPITPGLRPHRVDRASRDRKRRDRSFEEEFSEGRDEAHKPRRPAKPPTAARREPPPGPPASGGTGHLLDLEA